MCPTYIFDPSIWCFMIVFSSGNLWLMVVKCKWVKVQCVSKDYNQNIIASGARGDTTSMANTVLRLTCHCFKNLPQVLMDEKM